MNSTTRSGGSPLKVLVVDDTAGDAALIQELLRKSYGGEPADYRITHVTRLGEAMETLAKEAYHVVLLDLDLPDSHGVDTVRRMSEFDNRVPIVVMTGLEDEVLGEECISAGAEDFFPKDDLTSMRAQRSIGFALGRSQRARVLELERLLDTYQNMASQEGPLRPSSEEASHSSQPLLRERDAEAFRCHVSAWRRLLTVYTEFGAGRRPRPAARMSLEAARLGELGASPRDLVEIHAEALRQASEGATPAKVRIYTQEGRMMALEMMGHLVEFYRVGPPRR